MSKAAPSQPSDPALVPLRADSVYGGNSSDIIMIQAARPETWREAWPGDPSIIHVRDLLTACFRRDYHFQADSFLPDDAMGAIMNDMSAALLDDSYDLVEFVIGIEEALDVKIDDELAFKVKASTTYLQFIELLLPQLSPEYVLRPLVLPGCYFRAGWRASFKRWLTCGRYHHELRAQQARRTPDWVEKWADQDSPADLRNRVALILAEQLDWPAPAFVPEDQLAALFHHKDGPKKTLAAVQALNQQFDSDLMPDFPTAADRTLLDLLQQIDCNKK